MLMVVLTTTITILFTIRKMENCGSLFVVLESLLDVDCMYCM